MQRCIQSGRGTQDITLAMRGVAGHIAAGVALASLFVALLITSSDSAARQLLLQSDNAPALLMLLILHAGLFTCASLATTDVGRSTGPDD